MLVGYVANAEQVSHFDALKIIEKERDNIIFLLDKGEKVALEETGELFLDEKSDIQFIAFQDENLLNESFGLEPISLEKLMEEKPGQEIEDLQQAEEPEPEAKDETTSVNTDQEEESEKLVEEKPDEEDIESAIAENDKVEETAENKSDLETEHEEPSVKIMTETVFVTTKKSGAGK